MKKLTEEQIRLIATICSKASFDDSVELFSSNMHLLSTVSIIKSNQDDSGIDLYEPFKDIPEIENHLYTPFVNGKVNYINNKIIMRYLRAGNAFARDQRTISFDTQTVSYLKRHYDGKQKELPQNLNSVLKLMHLKKIGVDYFPYTFENLLYRNLEKTIISDNLYAFEKLYHNGGKSDSYCRNQATNIINSYEKMKASAVEAVGQMYDGMV